MKITYRKSKRLTGQKLINKLKTLNTVHEREQFVINNLPEHLKFH